MVVASFTLPEPFLCRIKGRLIQLLKKAFAHFHVFMASDGETVAVLHVE